MIAAWKCGGHLVALLWRVLIVSNPDDIHQDTCVCQGDLGPHVLGNTRRSMQGDRFPNQIRFRIGNAVAPEKFARSVGAINFKPLSISMISVDKSQVVKQRRD